MAEADAKLELDGSNYIPDKHYVEALIDHLGAMPG